MGSRQRLEVFPPAFEGKIGVARCEITPPVGIYSRMWGAAEHDVAGGIHRPLYATVLSFAPPAGGRPLVLAGLDLGWWRSADDEWLLRGGVLQALSLDADRLMIHVVHTHAGPSTSLEAGNRPGGEKIRPYLCAVRDSVVRAAARAIEGAELSTLAWTTGRCCLAANRDLPDPRGEGLLCGFNPDAPADDTLLVGRVTSGPGRIVATIVNYACHPTSLGGANRLISPDYVGAMRQTVEEGTGGAACLFLQGASGELGPRRGFEADPEIADQNGRQLGYAALSALAGMLPHRKGLAFAGAERSGAMLGRWKTVEQRPLTALEAIRFGVNLPLKDLPSVGELDRRLSQCDDRVTAERLERTLHQRQGLGEGDRLKMPAWCWRLGDSVLIGTPAEAFSGLQIQLRRQFPDRAVAVYVLAGLARMDAGQSTIRSPRKAIPPGG